MGISSQREKNHSKKLKTKSWEHTAYGVKEGKESPSADRRKEHKLFRV